MTSKTRLRENAQLMIVARKLLDQYPVLYNDLLDVPLSDDFNEIPRIISFIEEKEGLHPYNGTWEFQLSGKKKSDFIYLALGVIVLLFDPEFFNLKKNLRHGLRGRLSDEFKMIGSGISARLECLKDQMSVYPSLAERIRSLADEYCRTK
jgi:hypothetical protein